jgi:UDP-N-acetylglucosamine 1-carboxyvinyltransferase
LEKIYITGGNRLEGAIEVSGSKNATLAILAAALLAEGDTILENIPQIEDIYTMAALLRSLGATVDSSKPGTMIINASQITACEAPYEIVKKMRASFYATGAVLARRGYARIPMPGGCDIGARPVDLHIKGFQALGADVVLDHGYVEAKADRLVGSSVYFDFPSAGATGHLMITASLAEGTTILENCAEEPEIVDLANFLNAMGANIQGAGTKIITIEGVEKLKGVRYRVIPDRMEAGTFAVAAAITGGDILIRNAPVDHMKPVIVKLQEAGVNVHIDESGLRVTCTERPHAVDIKTMPHPGFPTDMQQPMAAMLCLADGTSVITETVYESRFKYISELIRMGADIKVEGRSAIIKGVEKLTGASVNATDLRAGAAIILAALAAEGRSEISNIEHIDRGYERIVEKFQAVGAGIVRYDLDLKKPSLRFA